MMFDREVARLRDLDRLAVIARRTGTAADAARYFDALDAFLDDFDRLNAWVAALVAAAEASRQGAQA